jgi:hypothetical protein
MKSRSHCESCITTALLGPKESIVSGAQTITNQNRDSISDSPFNVGVTSVGEEIIKCRKRPTQFTYRLNLRLSFTQRLNSKACLVAVIHDDHQYRPRQPHRTPGDSRTRTGVLWPDSRTELCTSSRIADRDSSMVTTFKPTSLASTNSRLIEMLRNIGSILALADNKSMSAAVQLTPNRVGTHASKYRVVMS